MEIPTGGIPIKAIGEPASAPCDKEVSRSGEMPGPTVIVRKKENQGEKFVFLLLHKDILHPSFLFPQSLVQAIHLRGGTP